MAKSRSEILEQKKEREKERRARIRKDPMKLEEQNRKRRERYNKNAQVRKSKKAKMSERDKRQQRRKWKLIKRKQREKIKTLAPSTSTSDKSVQWVTGQKMRDKNRRKLNDQIRKNQGKIRKLEARVEMYRKRHERLKQKFTNKSDSPRSVLNKELRNSREKVSPKVRRKLLFGVSLAVDVKSSFGSQKCGNRRRELATKFKLKYVKKYNFMSIAKPFIPVNYNYRRLPEASFRKKLHLLRNSIVEFFESDENSCLAPGKKDVIVRKKVRKQKRYLNNSLQYLHQRFCETNSFVCSFSSFCKFRPFWVIPRNIHIRDTCLCEKHENIELLYCRMKHEKLVNESVRTLDELIEKEMCCTVPSEDCLFRKCEDCSEKFIECLLFDGEKRTYYDTWQSEMETNEEGKSFRKTKKCRIECSCVELVNLFFERIPAYMSHLANIRHQYSAIKELKKNLSVTDALLHIDFSENYACKYSREIQSVHFGGNRIQFSLHTVMAYVGSTKQAFCTASKQLKHDPIAIVNHLQPIFEAIGPNITTLNFLSDSPSSQYRNKSMFYSIFHFIIPSFPNLEKLTWNYSESGHGKGAPDGIGAVVKRTADKVVSSGAEDISNFDSFFKCVEQRVKKVKIIAIENDYDGNREADVKNAPAVKGIKKS